MKINAIEAALRKSSAAPQIGLDLSGHCIQTALRRRYEKRVAQYFKSKADRDAMETEIDLLQRALETLDFGVLRSRWPALAGGRQLSVSLRLAEDRILIELAGETIRAPLRHGMSDL